MLHDRNITISAAGNRRATNWQAQSLMLSELYAKLQVPARGKETIAEYLALSKSQQDDLKDAGGYVAGALNGPRRKANAVAGRDVITLDLDNIGPGKTDDVLKTVEALGCGYCVYSTRKHQPSAPRLRVLLPLDRTCTADEYEPCARRMAEWIGLDMADPTTFEASRLMYWGSCCADGEYIYRTADKPMLSVDGLLGTYADWRDYTSWPQVPSAPSPARAATKQGDPETKPGAVGAFCKVYDVPAAMDKFIPHAYIECDNAPGRYTYTGGSTTGGAVLYDGGKFLYSHHATDPCSGRLVNAFDMVRLHRFEGLDDDAAPGTPWIRLPSYKAMCELATQDPQVANLIMSERWEQCKTDFRAAETPSDGMGGAESGETTDDGSWLRPPIMDVDGQLKPIKSLKNYKAALEHCPDLRGKIRLNQFTGRISVKGDLPWDRPGKPKEWTDGDTVALRIYLEPHMGKIADKDARDAVLACANAHAYHPVRDYLNSLTWDGVERLDRLFIDYMGADDTPYVRAVTRKSVVAAVARVMQPGCKYDTMLVLVGAQGRYKSTIFKKLGGKWFSESLRTFAGKEAMETIQGTWINEIGEMQALGVTEINAAKAFISAASDFYRASYGVFAMEHPRQCVFFGTTNTAECLTDRTGGRRFWPIDIDRIERTKNVFTDLDGERDQIWAEAVVRYRNGESLILSESLEKVAKQEQEAHRRAHPWEGMIEEFVNQPIPESWNDWDEAQRQMFYSGNAGSELKLVPREYICTVEIWCEMLGKRRGELTERASRELHDMLSALPGWEKYGLQRVGKLYGPQRYYRRKH